MVSQEIKHEDWLLLYLFCRISDVEARQFRKLNLHLVR